MKKLLLLFSLAVVSLNAHPQTQWLVTVEGYNSSLNRRIMDIGDMNLNYHIVDNNVNTWEIPFPIEITGDKIRSIAGIVRNDANDNFFPISQGDNEGGYGVLSASPDLMIDGWTTTAVYIVLNAEISNRFIGTYYDSIPYNRGWLIIDFIK